MRKKRKGKGRVGNDTYNTMYKIELIVKEIKHTKSNKKFSDSICQEERLRRFLKNLVAKIYQIKKSSTNQISRLSYIWIPNDKEYAGKKLRHNKRISHFSNDEY